MADRLASEADVLNFLKGGSVITKSSEQETALLLILEGVSAAIEEEILRTPGGSLAQATYAENYGNEHYGNHSRRVIRLRHWPVVSVNSIVDNLSTVDPASYNFDANAAIIRLIYGRFSDLPYAVVVNYTAGWASQGSDTVWPTTTSLAVPVSLRNACLQQVAFEYSQREPGGPSYGATAITRPDGSLILEYDTFLKPVKRAIDRFKLR